MKLSILFPVYNEAGSIINVLESFFSYCITNNIDHELLVVDDGSSDTSDVLVQEFIRTHPTVKLIEHQKNQGYGAALRSGFSAASGDHIFYTDGDGQFTPDDLEQTISLLDDRSIILGYRKPRTEGAIRRWNAWWWGRFIGLIFGFRVRDLNCAWKAFPRSLLTNVNLISSGAFISAEIVFYARQKNLIFHEILVHHYARKFGLPTGANVAVIFRAFRELANFLFRRGQKHEAR